MSDNWYAWQEYVNSKLDVFTHYMETREKDLEMSNIRMSRLLDAALQRLGEQESQVRELQEENAYLERKSA